MSTPQRPNSEHWLRGNRAGHRARSHAEAHGEHAPKVDSIPGHPLIPQGAAELIDSNEQCASLIDHLRDSSSFAYDTEFIGELSYVPKLCLIQVATAQRVALIDPLANIDLIPFWELLADPAIEKVVHSGAQDIEPVVRILGRPAANIFDTQIAAGMAGSPYPLSLSKLVYELVGHKLGKGLTFTHWDQRPLSVSQLRYAADDVRYLPAARAELGRRLNALQHASFVGEECDELCDPSIHRFDPDTQFLRIRGASSLPPAGLSALRELTRWRDAVAREANAPPRGFLKDEILLDLARMPARTIEHLSKIRGLPRPVEEQYGRDLIAIIDRGLQAPREDLPDVRQTEETAPERFRADSLWAMVQILCIGKQFDPGLIGSRQEIAELSRRVAAGQALDDLRIMKGWRRTVVGQPILELFAGKLHCRLSWLDGALRIADCGPA